MPVSLGYIPEGEVLLEPINPSAPLPLPPINPVLPPPPTRNLTMCTQEVGSVRDPVTGEMVQYTNGCQKADILAKVPISYPIVDRPQDIPFPTDEAQASADALVNLTNKVGEKARLDMASGILLRYLEGVAMGTLLFESAVSQKLFDMNISQMSSSLEKMTQYSAVPSVPAYLEKVAKLQFFSDTMNEGQANTKFQNAYGSALGPIVTRNGTFYRINSMQAEQALYDIVQKASMDSSFGAEVVVSFLPTDQNQQSQIVNDTTQAVQKADSFIAENAGIIESPVSELSTATNFLPFGDPLQLTNLDRNENPSCNNKFSFRELNSDYFYQGSPSFIYKASGHTSYITTPLTPPEYQGNGIYTLRDVNGVYFTNRYSGADSFPLNGWKFEPSDEYLRNTCLPGTVPIFEKDNPFRIVSPGMIRNLIDYSKL